MCDHVFNGIWMEVARSNTAAFEAVFPHIPSNNNSVCQCLQ